LLNQFDLVYSDGVGVVWAGRFLERRKLYKVTGRAWIEEFCGMCQEQGISLYLLGGLPGIAREAQRRLQGRLPKLQILGVCDGYFHEKNEAEVLGELEVRKPDVLLVGMGVPRQEKWIEANREQIPPKVCWAVGALFDYVAGAEPPVPAWMERLALEWLWRMVVDPQGKWERYMIGTPLFIGRVLRQKLKG
jgi:N-acetylglucosaminyldiphosphoundecaprenol N-acetyl-beta-D-mannosaminyltransferase